ncbi:MAG: orotidine-5'-phosphate decarboxylase [Bacillota bacterium]
MKLFIDRLIDGIKQKQTRVCVGLDPHLDLLPTPLLGEIAGVEEYSQASVRGLAAIILEFNRKIIEEVSDVVAVVKPQIAFYEELGPAGMETLFATIDYAQKQGLPVLLDAKKNDIGSTAGAYARAYLEERPDRPAADALTINPYLGGDGVKPFLKYPEKGAFALVRTSNQSAGDIQDLRLADEGCVYERVGLMVKQWGKDCRGRSGYSNLGAVVGATYPRELQQLRRQLPGVFFLIPGYGAQGGGASDVVGGFDENGLGAVVNSSRGISFAARRGPLSQDYDERDFARAARTSAIMMRDSINQALE